jgi:hypothetical protein
MFSPLVDALLPDGLVRGPLWSSAATLQNARRARQLVRASAERIIVGASDQTRSGASRRVGGFV